jgi:SPP1 family predicted phage head-tail adaptor
VTGVLAIDPGKLRHEMRVEAPSLAADGLGGASETWVQVAVIFAMIEPISARQRHEAAQDLESITHRITARRNDTLKSGRRLRKGKRVFRIATIIDPDETGRWAECIAEELP